MASASGDSSGSDGGLGQRRRRPLSSRSFAFNLLIFTIAGLSLYSQPGALAKISEEDTVLLSEQQAVQSGVAKLPCDISPPLQGDKVHLVIWSKVGVVKPIYTFDARLNSIDQAKHWADETLGGRASFHYMEDPSKLKVENVRDSDSGLYKCRVDFQKSPTRNSLVNLTVIIPPEKLSILDDQGTHIPHYILGPYNEGASIDITCVATGGRPTPRVTWWQENALLDDTFEVLPERRVRNVLRLERLQRKHLHTVFTCQASNNNLVAPISSAVTLDMNLRPLIVRLKGENKPLSADNTYELACEVWGSRPTPTITWWKGSIPMRNTREIIDPDGNKTTSILTFVPTIDDGGKYLSCRAVQSLIPDSGLEDGWKLDIYHVPVVTLELGSNLNGSTIREGVDVYFECNIKSNPWVYKVSWRHNGKLLYNNFEAGTIVSNQSLVLQGVTRARAGLYTCVGSNHEGDGESNPVHLDVKFAPVCRPGQAKVHGVARQETARITCELEANPNDVQFTWKFNNSAEAVDIPQSHVAVDRARSIAAYTPMTELDYGTLMCWGRNEIGMQKEPCVYFINPAGKPDALHNCSILNQTADSLQVECVEGFDGGLTQEFVMEVYDSTNKKLVTNVTSRSPYFAVGGLESGIGFEIVLFATNKKGRSDVTPLQAYTLKSEKHTGGSEKPQPPQNCSVSHHSSKAVRVSCEPPDDNGENLTTFMMQVFDADTRHLLGSTTSLTADKLEIWDLPRETDGSLILSIRTIAARSTSEAVILYSAPATSLEQQRGANTPVLLQITPILGALIGVVTALVMVAIVIVVVIRLRGHGDQDDKDCSDGGSGTGNRRTVASGGDKASTEPLNKELDDSIDSLEEKNPDIIPQANGDDDYQDEEKAFERLNNAPPRIYSRLQSPNTIGRNSPYDTSFHGPKSNDEITYAELSLSTNKTLPHVLYNSHPAHQKTIPMSLIRRPDMPTMYAHIDVSKRPTLPTIQPLSPPHSTALPLLHHQHHSLQSTAYLPRPSHEEMHLLHDAPVTAETPLINSRESTV